VCRISRVEQRRSSTVDDIDGRVDKKNTSGRVKKLPKTLFALFQCRISKTIGSGDLPSWSQMHVDARDKRTLMVAKLWAEAKT
jgi:hypothetical protein